MLNLITWLKWCLFRLLHCIVTSLPTTPSYPFTLYSEKKSLCRSGLRSRKLWSPTLRGKYPHKLHIWNSSALEVCFLCLIHSFIQSIIMTHQYGLTYVYFILWVRIQYNSIHFVAHIVPALVLGTLSSWLLCPFEILMSTQEFRFCFFLNTILLSGTTKYSRFILHISCPSFRICHFSKESCSFLWRTLWKPRSGF